MRPVAIFTIAALLAGCAATPDPAEENLLDPARIVNNGNSAKYHAGLADPFTSPEIPEIYETPPKVRPPAK